AHDLHSEFVVRGAGTVRRRPEGMENPEIATGDVEVSDCEVEVLSLAEPPPFPVSDRIEPDEVLRLRHRYIDLRRPVMQERLRLRATVNHALRAAMDDQGFVEVETPLLVVPTPEGLGGCVVQARRGHGGLD